MNDTKIINGEAVPLTATEQAEHDQRAVEWSAGQIRRGALAQIDMLEASITKRRTREAVLGKDNGWLADIEAQIAALRTQI